MKHIKIILLILIGSFVHTLRAQPMNSIGQFQYNPTYYNPAAAGIHSRLVADALHRNQWTSFPGAPQMQLLSADAPVGKNVGLGAYLSRFSIGNYKDWQVTMNASYRINFKNSSVLQFGLSLSAKHIDYGLQNAFLWDASDPIINGAQLRGIVYKIGAGVVYKKESTFIGLSCSDLITADPSKLFYDNTKNKSLLQRNIHLMAGTKIYLTEYIALLPSAMYSYYSSQWNVLTVNVGAEFNQTFTAGIGASTYKSVGLFTRISISPKIKIGYRYEYTFGAVRTANYGTNEIQLSYGFN